MRPSRGQTWTSEYRIWASPSYRLDDDGPPWQSLWETNSPTVMHFQFGVWCDQGTLGTPGERRGGSPVTAPVTLTPSFTSPVTAPSRSPSPPVSSALPSSDQNPGASVPRPPRLFAFAFSFRGHCAHAIEQPLKWEEEEISSRSIFRAFHSQT